MGRSAPDFELVDGTRLGEHLRSGTGLFLDFDARKQLQALASRWSDRITYVASDAKDRLGLSAMLVRPDGFVAWADEAARNHEEAAQAASLWFGEPEEVRQPTYNSAREPALPSETGKREPVQRPWSSLIGRSKKSPTLRPTTRLAPAEAGD